MVFLDHQCFESFKFPKKNTTPLKIPTPTPTAKKRAKEDNTYANTSNGTPTKPLCMKEFSQSGLAANWGIDFKGTRQTRRRSTNECELVLFSSDFRNWLFPNALTFYLLVPTVWITQFLRVGSKKRSLHLPWNRFRLSISAC